MPYVLGIDIGTVRTAAAVSRLRRGEWGEAEVVRLGSTSATIASVLRLSPDGPLPGMDTDTTLDDNVVRGFLRRVGDDVPMVFDGQPYRAPALTAALARWVITRVESAEGSPAQHVVFTLPAGWGPYRRGLFHEALWRVGLENTALVTEPVAAVGTYLATEQVDVAATLAVYSLGGAHCECSVLRRTGSATFELLASAETSEPIGGADLDDRLIEWVRASVGPAAGFAPDDPGARLATHELRERCVAAKEELSTAAEVTIRVPTPTGRTEVTLTRAEFEQMIRPVIDPTVTTLLRTIRAASISPEELDAVILVGGTARVPLVRELVATAVPGRVAVETDPDLSVARGAARAAQMAVAPPDSMAAYRPRVEPRRPAPPATEQVTDLAGEALDPLDRPARPTVLITPLKAPRPQSAQRAARELRAGVRMAVIGLLLVVIAAGILLISMSSLGHGS